MWDGALPMWYTASVRYESTRFGAQRVAWPHGHERARYSTHRLNPLKVPYFTAYGPDAVSRFVLNRDFRDSIY